MSDEMLNDILLYAPESFDGDDAAEVYAVRYVRWLESQCDKLPAVCPTCGCTL